MSYYSKSANKSVFVKNLSLSNFRRSFFAKFSLSRIPSGSFFLRQPLDLNPDARQALKLGQKKHGEENLKSSKKVNPNEKRKKRTAAP